MKEKSCKVNNESFNIFFSALDTTKSVKYLLGKVDRATRSPLLMSLQTATVPIIGPAAILIKPTYFLTTPSHFPVT